MKVCAKCKGDPQPLDQFHRNCTEPDGHNRYCKVCARAISTACARANSYWTQRGKEIARQRKQQTRGAQE